MKRKVKQYYENIYCLSLILFLFINTIEHALAQEQSKIERLKNKRNRFFAVPLISYSPETKWAFGFTSQYLTRFKNDSVSNPSITGLTFLYTLNKQYIINPNWDFFFLKNKYRATGAFVYQRYPDSFFGIGNATNEGDKEKFSSDYLLLKQRMVKQFTKGFYTGFQYRFEKTYNLKKAANSIFDTENVTGNNGYTASGIGLAVIYDTRDNVLFPFKGFYVTVSNHFYPKWLGTTFPITNINIDARHYWNFYKSHVVATNIYTNVNFGNTPFKMMAQLGGQNLMRGYFQGRYRANNMAIAQVEYRFPIYWRFIGVVFASAGDVFQHTKDMSFNNLKISGGGGLRFTIDAKERINLRFDYAFGRFNSRGFYLSISEAF
jgi:outer membrane protein assembly factor BamA